MNKLAVVLSSLLATQVAFADPHQVLVLKADGSADASTRARVDAAVLKLAKTGGGAGVTPSEISFGDAAAATGCKPEAPACRDEVMTTLSVDELVITTATVSGGELRVSVKRVAKGQPVKDATVTVPAIDPSTNAIEVAVGPLFGVKVAADTKPAPANPANPTNPTEPKPTGNPSDPGPANPTTSPFANPTTGPTDPYAATTGTTGDHVTAAPNGVVDAPEGNPHKRLEYAGIGTGGGMVLLAFIMWGAAGQTATEIAAQPTNTPADFRRLRDLENQGDAQAGFGNLMFVGGLVLGGISGYYLWKDNQHADSSRQARVAPAIFDHGAGVTLTIGGAP